MRLHINSLGKVSSIFTIFINFNLERGINEESAIVEEEEVDVAIDVRLSRVAMFVNFILNVCSNGYKLHIPSLRVLKDGTRWRVGNGKRIHIWEDRWLPTPTTYRVTSPQSDFGNFPMVSSLIDDDTKWWKTDLVRSIFLPHEATTILKIPISFRLPDN